MSNAYPLHPYVRIWPETSFTDNREITSFPSISLRVVKDAVSHAWSAQAWEDCNATARIPRSDAQRTDHKPSCGACVNQANFVRSPHSSRVAGHRGVRANRPGHSLNSQYSRSFGPCVAAQGQERQPLRLEKQRGEVSYVFNKQCEVIFLLCNVLRTLQQNGFSETSGCVSMAGRAEKVNHPS